jgi:hypothetical protein
MALTDKQARWAVGGSIGAAAAGLGYWIWRRRHEHPTSHEQHAHHGHRGHEEHAEHEDHEEHENQRGEYGHHKHKHKHHHEDR